MPASLICDAGSLGYPLANGGIKFCLTLLAGSYDTLIYGYQTIRKGIFKTGVLSALVTFQ